MKIYSKTFNILTNLMDRSKLNNLDLCEFDVDDVFYYDRYDLSIRNISFDNFVEEIHWNHITNNPKTKILINYSDDYFNMVDIERFSNTIIEKNINPNQIYFVAMDKNFENFAIEGFKKFGLTDINVSHQNSLLKTINFNYVENLFIENNTIENTQKFTALSRNYHPWRLNVYLKLLNGDTLKYFDYTFNNINPYENIIFSIDELKEDVINLGYNIDNVIESWLSDVPYEIGGTRNKWIVDIDYTIYKNDFNLIIESHYDAFLYRTYAQYRDKFTIDEFSPAFITEKTWKAILCKKPFLTVSVPYSLRDLRKLGYKTYSPFIDESYDLIEDNDLRMDAIIKEVERICNLDENEYNELKSNCESIAEYNFNLLKSEFNKTADLSENFNFLIDFM